MFNRPSSGRGCRCRLGRKGRARAPRPLRPARPVPRSPEPQAPEYYGLLRLEIRNPISSGGGLLATAKGQGDAALTPVAVPGGRPRLWPSRGRPGKSGGIWKLPLRRSPLWTPVSRPQHCPAVWGRMLPCWSLPLIPGCTLGLQPLGARSTSTCPPSPSWDNQKYLQTLPYVPWKAKSPCYTGKEVGFLGGGGGGDASDYRDSDRISESGLKLSSVMPGKSQNPWASVSLSLKWEEKQKQMQGVWRSAEVMPPLAL